MHGSHKILGAASPISAYPVAVVRFVGIDRDKKRTAVKPEKRKMAERLDYSNLKFVQKNKWKILIARPGWNGTVAGGGALLNRISRRPLIWIGVLSTASGLDFNQ